MELLAFILLAVWGWFAWDSVGAKEIARQKGRQKCMTYGLQFLDDTVAVSRTRLRRDAQGRVAVYRKFNFEFSADGLSRHNGTVELLGRYVIRVELEAYPRDQLQ